MDAVQGQRRLRAHQPGGTSQASREQRADMSPLDHQPPHHLAVRDQRHVVLSRRHHPGVDGRQQRRALLVDPRLCPDPGTSSQACVTPAYRDVHTTDLFALAHGQLERSRSFRQGHGTHARLFMGRSYWEDPSRRAQDYSLAVGRDRGDRGSPPLHRGRGRWRLAGSCPRQGQLCQSRNLLGDQCSHPRLPGSA